MSVRIGLALILAGAAVSPAYGAGQQPPAGQPKTGPSNARPELRPHRVQQPPAIDGLLDDEAWQQAPLETPAWQSYNPLHGDTIPQKTRVWMAYDLNYIYFAFQCDDPEPGAIKTSVTRRDNIWSDDWVGFSLDALGTGQTSYHFMANPSGVQLDMLNSAAGNEDESPDYIWDSAGRLNTTGYAVEMRVPLQTIRFRGGDDVRMGVLFWRRVSRTGVSIAWPALEPGKWVFEKHASLVFGGLRTRPLREVIPSATYSRNAARDLPDHWGPADDDAEIGISAKYGLSSTITLEATANPDFSQVESDAFQVEVNQRFPIFFSEKRPFFMEGSGIFTLAGQGNDNSLQRAVHTRRIVDPVFGAKLTGSAGRFAFGTLTALDQAAGRGLSPAEPGAGKDRLFNVLRGQYSLGPSNYVGGLVIDTEFAGGFNRVAGADLSWRVTGTQRMSAFVLASASRLPGMAETSTGFGGQAGYEYTTQRWQLAGFGEHYDPDFRLDTAFINRVGITSGWGFVQYNIYPDKARYPWVRRISPFSFTQGGRDRNAGGNDLVQVSAIRINFTRQGFLRADRIDGFETWAGRRFDRGNWRLQGNVQLYRWLYLDGQVSTGAAVFYDPHEPFQGSRGSGRLGVTLQPGGRFSQALSYNRVDFRRASTGERVYDVDIIYGRTTYQFTRQFFIRAIAQFDSSRYRVLTDFLASYELRPGTVVYAGYGSLLERRELVDGEWILGRGDYDAARRGVFFKASYLHRF